MRLLVKLLFLISVFFIGSLIFLKSIEYYTPDFSKGYLADKKIIFDGVFKYGLYAHIVSVPIVLAIGTIQVLFRYEETKRRLHSSLGKIYIYLILLFSAPGGLLISFYAFGGLSGKVSFIMLSILWFLFTYKGLLAANSKDFISHKNFMIRSYVLMLSAIFLRIISYIFIHFLHFHGNVAYAIASWLSWFPFLLIAELLLIKSKRSKPFILIHKDY